MSDDPNAPRAGDPGAAGSASGTPRPEPGPGLPDPAVLLAAPAAEAMRVFRAAHSDGTRMLFERYDAGVPVSELVIARSDLVDLLLRCAWERFLPDANIAALVAVGGYGRRELHPASDVDLLVLLADAELADLKEHIGSFVTFLYDIGLQPGYSVRTVEECQEQARADITVMTNLIEARLLTGRADLFEAMREATAPEHLWPSDAFFNAKCKEQLTRWNKFGETAYSLEPNIKENPGGLRDIQMIAWVTKRHYGTGALSELLAHGFLTQPEYLALLDGQALLWRIRFALHRLTGRREDRLLFDYQRTLANAFGFTDQTENLAVEQFMQQYYRAVMELNRLNEMLLQLFREVILLHERIGPPQPINSRFQHRSGYLEVTHDRVFARHPIALLEAFHLLQLRPELIGIRASTIRLIRENRHRIDDGFREDMGTRSLFMEILRHPVGVGRALRRMNRYGVLAAYIPHFANVVGRMQYDLFHVYTVDEHTLRVLRNLRRFTADAYQDEFPLCTAIARRIPKLELLYIAGLFHDIGKGRGGDHSLIGARDAWDFCRLHYLSEFDSHLVAWLVENHLAMSMTAQRKDISDPTVVQAFAERVSDQARLDTLYLLTVADVRGTNPKRWSSWKDALLRELYLATRRALSRGLDNPQAQDQLIEQKQIAAMRLLAQRGIDAEDCRNLWFQFSLDFFAPSEPEEIAWQTERILATPPADLPLVDIRPVPSRGCSEVLIYTQDQDGLFVRITALLDQRALNVVDARIMTTGSGMALNVFRALNYDQQAMNAEDSEELVALLRAELVDLHETGDVGAVQVNRRIPRAHKHFPIETRISFAEDSTNARTIMLLTTLDRPGLLAEIGSVLESCDIRLQSAKIATVGAEVDDLFFITTSDATPITCETALACLRRAIHQRLEQPLG